MSSLAEGLKIVARMTPMRADGSLAAVVFLAFEGEPEEEAEAFEVVKEEGRVRLLPCAGKLADWRRVAALVAAEGGK